MTKWTRVVPLAAALLLVGAFWLGTRVPSSDGRPPAALLVYEEVLREVVENYVEPVRAEELTRSAIRGLARTLDPHTGLLLGPDIRREEEDEREGFEGLGIVWLPGEHPVVIAAVEGTPAERAGIRSGDRIVAVDGRDTRFLPSQEVSRRLRGPSGSLARLAIRRGADERTHIYLLRRARIDVASVPFAGRFEGEIGYLRVSQFTATAAREAEEALAALTATGPLRGLVLDLRGNPGGLLREAVSLSELFVPAGEVIVSTRGRHPEQSRTYVSARARRDPPPALVVLIDGGSASASEIVAGAVQDLDLGAVVGTTSFGKGSVQVTKPIGPEMALRITTARYYTPSGRSIDRRVAPPDSSLDAVVRRGEPDTAAVFRTKSGRIVRGGGGIRPDRVIASAPPDTFVLGLERDGLIARFAEGLPAARAAGSARSVPVAPGDPELRPEGFARFLERRGRRVHDGDVARSWSAIASRIRREAAYRSNRPDLARRAALEGDESFLAALDLLRRAKTTRELLALAGEDPG